MPVVINELEETVESPQASRGAQSSHSEDPAEVAEQIRKTVELLQERSVRVRAY